MKQNWNQIIQNASLSFRTSRAKHFSFVYINNRKQNRTEPNRAQHSHLMIKDWEINVILFGIGCWSKHQTHFNKFIINMSSQNYCWWRWYKMFAWHHRPAPAVPAQILFETLFQKISTPPKCSSPLFRSSSLNIVVAECLEMLTGTNMFYAPSFVCSVLFTRSVIWNSTEIWAFSPTRTHRERRKRANGGGMWVNEQTKQANKMKNERPSERASEWMNEWEQEKRTRCALAYFSVSTEFENATIWQLDRTVGIDKYLLLQLMYLESGW